MRSLRLRLSAFFALSAALMVLVALSAAGTVAYFSDTENGTFDSDAGIVDIVEGQTASVDLDLAYVDLLPDVADTKTFEITNVGTGPVDLYLWLDPGAAFDPCTLAGGQLNVTLTGVAGAADINICSLVYDDTGNGLVGGTGLTKGANAPVKIADNLAVNGTLTQDVVAKLTASTTNAWQNIQGDAALRVYAAQQEAPAFTLP